MEENPQRWSKGKIRNWDWIDKVILNPKQGDLNIKISA